MRKPCFALKPRIITLNGSAIRIMSDTSFLQAAAPRRLTGATLVVTRPADSARELIAPARAMGADTVALPGLALRISRRPTTALAQLRAAEDADICLFSSPASVRFAFRLLPTLSLGQRGRICAIGNASARALARHGIRAIVPQERSDSEGLLALPELADVRGQRIAIVGAAGGRDLIAPTLRERGATVDEIHVYERVPPRLTQQHFDALRRADDPLIMLVSSAQALTHLVARLPPPLLARLHRQTLIVSSERLADIASSHGFGNITRARSALVDDLLEAAARALAHHRL